MQSHGTLGEAGRGKCDTRREGESWQRPRELGRSACDPRVTLGANTLSSDSVVISYEIYLPFVANQFPAAAVTICHKLGDFK